LPNDTPSTDLNTCSPPHARRVALPFPGSNRTLGAIDPTATNPADTLNCLLYEVKPTSNSTSLKAYCRIGATPLSTTTIASDIPNAGGTYDRYIETLLGTRLWPGSSDLAVFGAYSHRQTGTVRSFAVDPATQTLYGPALLGDAPPGTGFYGVSGAAVLGDGVVHSFWPQAPNEPAHHVETPIDPTAFQLQRVGPVSGGGVVSGGYWETGDIDFWKVLYIIVSGNDRRAEAPGVGGLAISIYPLPLFDDGLDTGDTVRWSAAVP
jgi:hypothetical protein